MKALANKRDLIQKALLAISALALTSCAPDVGGVALNQSTANGARSATSALNQAAMNLPTPGAIYTDASNQAAFQQTVAGLVSTDLPESSLGVVSARWENGTGVAFGAKFVIGNNVALSSLGTWGSTAISSTSVLKIVVAHSNQQTVGQPTLTYGRASGYIQASQVTVRFSDNYGSITLQGQITSGRFMGSISYDNLVLYDGTRPGAAGTLGAFDVAACEVFRCY